MSTTAMGKATAIDFVKRNIYPYLKTKLKSGEKLKDYEREMFKILSDDETLNIHDDEGSESDSESDATHEEMKRMKKRDLVPKKLDYVPPPKAVFRTPKPKDLRINIPTGELNEEAQKNLNASIVKFKDNMSLLTLNTGEIFDIFSYLKVESSHLNILEEFNSHKRFIEKKVQSIETKLVRITELIGEDQNN